MKIYNLFPPSLLFPPAMKLFNFDSSSSKQLQHPAGVLKTLFPFQFKITSVEPIMHFYTYSCAISVTNGCGVCCVKGTFHAFSGLAGVLRTL